MRRRRAGRCGTGWKPTGTGACWCSITRPTRICCGRSSRRPGSARVIITSNQQSVAHLGAGVPVDVFTEGEALTFLAARTGQADATGAAELAAELGCLPLALAQAAAVIAAQHLSYATYLERLRRLPVADLLAAEEAGQYPRGVAAAVLLSLDHCPGR